MNLPVELLVGIASLAAVLAFGLNTVLTPAIIRLAHRFKWYDVPDRRKLHTGLIPRLGGVGMFLSTAVALSAVLVLLGALGEAPASAVLALLPAIAGITIIHIVGLIDDFVTLRARTKLIFQLIAASIVAAGGLQIGSFSLPYLGSFELGIVAIPVTVIWIVGLTNALNLIDGMDGLAGGIAAFAAAGMAVIALIQGQVVTAAIALALFGAICGFLVFNLPPASIFMGDSGSYLLGFTLATLPLLGISRAASLGTLIVPVTLLLIPIVDCAAAIVRRISRGRPLSAPDKDHIHHKLLALGLTDRKILVAVYSVSAYLMAVSITSVVMPKETELYLILVVWVGVLLAYGILAYVRNQRTRTAARPVARAPAASAAAGRGGRRQRATSPPGATAERNDGDGPRPA